MNVSNRRFRLSLLTCLMLTLISLSVLTENANATSPNLITYQGLLSDTNGFPVADSTYQVSFSFFSVRFGGGTLWTETAQITTATGQFTHLLGSVTPLPRTIFVTTDSIFLELSVNNQPLTPRTLFTSSPYALTSSGLDGRNAAGKIILRAIADSSSLVINQQNGNPGIVLRGGIVGDSSVILPDDAISSDEIKDEPGITVSINDAPVTLTTSTMIDLVTVDITLPENGYLVLEGKCYVELKGTTGANQAIIQIDQTQGGSSQFPYFAMVGLSGYVNTGSNYFSVYVTRPYFALKGTYRFRMEGRAQNPSPAQAVSWDHVLTVTYYPTAYDAVKSISHEQLPGGVPVYVDSAHPGDVDRTQPYYMNDLSQFKPNKKKTDPAPLPK